MKMKLTRVTLALIIALAALPLAAPAMAADETVYVVRPGDNLTRIAAANNIPLQALIDANTDAYPCLAQNPPCPILIGQQLVIPPAKTIVETAAEAGAFNTLLAAAQAAGLAETLNSGGPFTVLAPTDAAFARLPAGTVEALLADPDKLREVLLYHVLSGRAFSRDVAGLSSAVTVQGEPVQIRSGGGGIRINNARVVLANVPAGNGVIHVIDAVLLPPSFTLARQNIVETAASAGSFNTLLAAAQAAGLAETLQGPGPFTVFAPTDAAFAKLPPGTVESLLQNPEALRQVLLYHVVPGRVKAADVARLSSAVTAQGQPVSIRVSGGRVLINNATVVAADVEAANGVIHVIDTVLLPPG